jgi:predicted RND superfamily exporter protein
MQQQAMLVSYGILGEELKQATKAALDLGSAFDNLFVATTAVGKSFQGLTQTLKNFNITIDESVPKSERFAESMKQINEKFGGSSKILFFLYRKHQSFN